MATHVSLVANINAVVSGLFSLSLNGFIIVVILKGKSTTTGYYKWIIISTAIFDVTFSVINAFACPTIAAIGSESSVIIVKGGLQIPFLYGRILLIIWVILLCTSIVVSPCSFIFQYFQVCRAQWMALYGKRLLFALVIPFGLASVAASMLCVSAYPDAEDYSHFDPIALRLYLNEPRAYLVASLRAKEHDEDAFQSSLLQAACIYLVCILFISLLTMLICSRLIMVAVKRASSQSSSRLQNQALKVLLVQFAIPFLFIQIPFCACCLAPLLQMETDRISDYLPFLFAWSPVLNPIAVMCFVKDLRPSKKCLLFMSRNTAWGSQNKTHAGQNTNNSSRGQLQAAASYRRTVL
uniref:G_PROTEIN_RECEP_F1_2 domain-containing protein n=1 Tax=Haemonchus contortus TaxID=6289 RepID=A0A7I4YP60_HAECO